MVSYEELDSMVHAIAAKLQAIGITSGSRLAVLQKPTPDWVSTILAIMRLGATYLPLDVGLPWPRLAAIVKDCQPHAILFDSTTTGHVHRLDAHDIHCFSVSNLPPASPIPICATSNDVSTILYTSGSSGTPKGIMLTHQGIQSWLEPCGLLYGMRNTGEMVLQQSAQGFDMSLMQIFSALCFGGSVFLPPLELRGDAIAISEAIIRYNISHTYGTPSEYLSWLRYGNSTALKTSAWKTCLMGGELLAPSVVNMFAVLGKDDLRVHHMYGTTESTFCASVMELDYLRPKSYELQAGTQPTNFPAGVALPNYNLYILDDQRRPLPVGLQGEIYIGGAGVARGYLNHPSLTAETFVPDPFATDEDRARGWSMMQKTGDLGRWSSVDRGAILIEGRISGDTMVKLRGMRVDLREVEGAILRAGADALTEAVVSVRRSSPESPEFLVAHVVFTKSFAESGESFEKRLLKLRTQLEVPLYMRPAHITPLDSLPMTSSGKLDRNATGMLSFLDVEVANTHLVWTPTESRLRVIWEQTLSRDLSVLGLSPQVDFFHIGGTSMSLLGLRDRIKRQLNVQLTLVDLFEASVLSHMAHRIDGQVDVREVIDWEEETKLPSSFVGLDNRMHRLIPKSHSKVVVLTGGTGYLGKGLIHAMIRDPAIKEIHCLGVRNVASRTDLAALEKVILYEGDLNKPRIGLLPSIADKLFSRADLIIHNGADISYMKTYQSMRQSNFLTTKDLIDLSLPRMIPFHYISTADIGNFAPGLPLVERSVASTPPPTDGSAGYTACKWASERFLEKLVVHFPEWPVCVHRPTLISRDDISELDGVHNILGYARKLGAVPVSQGVARGVLNVVPLDTVVGGVLECALGPHKNGPTRTRSDGEVHFVNHKGEVELPLGNMRKWALEHTSDGHLGFSDVDFEEIPLDEWVDRAVKLGMHPTMAALLTSFARDGEVEFPTIAKGTGSKRDHALSKPTPPSESRIAAPLDPEPEKRSQGQPEANRRILQRRPSLVWVFLLLVALALTQVSR